MGNECCLHGLGGCGSGLQRHHFIEKQTLRRLHRSANVRPNENAWDPLVGVKLIHLLNDARNLFPICHVHHGQLHSGADGESSEGKRARRAFARVVEERMLELREFAFDRGLEYQLEQALEKYGIEFAAR